MFFSIIIPMYNSEGYIDECLMSLKSQTFTDFEVVIINDGSVDKGPDKVREFSSADVRFRMTDQENTGQSGARNRGLREAKGEYVIFMDSDDFVLSDDFLEALYTELEKNRVDMVFYRHIKYFEDRTQKIVHCGYTYEGTEGVTDPDKLLPILVGQDAYYGAPWIKAIRRTLLTDNGIKFDETLRCEDIDWSYRIMEVTRSISCIDREFMAYRQRQGSVSKQGSLRNAEDFLITCEKYKERYENPDIPLSQGLREALLGTLAKYYANLLINYGRIKNKDKKAMRQRLKRISGLLDYAMSSRPLTVRKVYRVFGFSLTVFGIGLLDRIKN